jgi:hypothetical protein
MNVGPTLRTRWGPLESMGRRELEDSVRPLHIEVVGTHVGTVSTYLSS